MSLNLGNGMRHLTSATTAAAAAAAAAAESRTSGDHCADKNEE